MATLLPPLIDDVEIVTPKTPAKKPIVIDYEADEEPIRHRPKRPKRPPPKGVPVAWIAGGSLAAVITMSFVGIAIWWSTRPGPTVAKTTTANDTATSIASPDTTETKNTPPRDEKTEPAKPKAAPPPAKPDPPPEPSPPLPSGWSYNASSMGFRAAFPVAADDDGVTPMSLFFKQGNQWIFSRKLAKGETQIWSVVWINLPNTGANDDETTLDNYVRKKQGQSSQIRAKILTHRGLPARELSYEAGRVVANRERVLIKGTTMWILFTNTDAQESETIDRFFDSFLPLSK